MTLQQIIDHLAACVQAMNANSDHALALKAQLAVVAVNDVQHDCVNLGFIDDTREAGDYPFLEHNGDSDALPVVEAMIAARAGEIRKRLHEDGSNDSANYNELDELLTLLGCPGSNGD